MAEKGRAGHTVLKELREKHPVFMQFLLFFIVCNGVTVLQLILMPVLKWRGIYVRDKKSEKIIWQESGSG